MFSEFNNKQIKNSKTVSETKALKSQSVKETKQVASVASDYKEFGEKVKSTRKTVNNILTSTVALAVVVLVTVGPTILEKAASSIQSFNLRTDSNILYVEALFSQYNDQDNLKLQITNDFTKREYKINDNIYENEDKYYFYDEIDDLVDNTTYTVKIVSGNYNVLAKGNISLTSIYHNSEVEHVFAEGYDSNIWINGEFISYFEQENIKLIIKGDNYFKSFDMKDIVMYEEHMDKYYFYTEINNLNPGLYQYYVVTSHSILYSDKVEIIETVDTITTIQEFGVEAETNIMFINLAFDNYEASENVYLQIKDGNTIIDTQYVDGQLSLDGGIYYYEYKKEDLMPNTTYVVEIYANDVLIGQKEATTISETETTTTVSSLSMTPSSNSLNIDIYFDNYDQNENVLIEVGSNQAMVGQYAVGEDAQNLGDMYYYNLEVTGLLPETPYYVQVYANDELIYSDETTTEVLNLTTQVSEFVLTPNEDSIGIDIAFTAFDANENPYLVVNDNSGMQVATYNINQEDLTPDGDNYYYYIEVEKLDSNALYYVELYVDNNLVSQDSTTTLPSPATTTFKDIIYEDLTNSIVVYTYFDSVNENDNIVLKITSAETTFSYEDSYTLTGNISNIDYHGTENLGNNHEFDGLTPGSTYNIEVLVDDVVIHTDTHLLKVESNTEVESLDYQYDEGGNILTFTMTFVYYDNDENAKILLESATGTTQINLNDYTTGIASGPITSDSPLVAQTEIAPGTYTLYVLVDNGKIYTQTITIGG